MSHDSLEELACAGDLHWLNLAPANMIFKLLPTGNPCPSHRDARDENSGRVVDDPPRYLARAASMRTGELRRYGFGFSA